MHTTTAFLAAADSGSPYTALESIGLFIGIPLAVVIVVSLLVLAPGWTRSARRGGSTDWSGEPLWIGTLAEGEPLAIVADGSDDLRGGTSAQW